MSIPLSSPSIDVMVVSHTLLNCEGVASLLRGSVGIGLVSIASDWDEITVTCRKQTPSVILLDAADTDGLSIVPALRQLGSHRIVVYGVRNLDAQVRACARAGVDGLCDTNSTQQELLRCIRGSVVGEVCISERISGILLRQLGNPGLPITRQSFGFTEREASIIALLRLGLSNKEMARKLGITTATVKNHVHNILTKLGVHRRTDVILFQNRQELR